MVVTSQPYKLDQLCDICQRIMLEAETLQKELALKEDVSFQKELVSIPFHVFESDIRLSIGRGCHLCAVLHATQKFRDN